MTPPAGTIGCRDAVAALLTGQAADPGLHRRATAHARVCPRCAALIDDPTAGEAILQGLAPHRLGPSNLLRGALAVISIFQLIIALPWLLGYEPYSILGEATKSHLTRDGALGLIVGAAGVLVVVRPRYALAGLLLTVVAASANALTGLIDHRDHEVAASFEFIHVLVLTMIVLLALCVGRHRYPRPGTPLRPEPLRPV